MVKKKAESKLVIIITDSKRKNKEDAWYISATIKNKPVEVFNSVIVVKYYSCISLAFFIMVYRY